MYAPCCPSCSDLIHYGIQHPMFAIVTVALVAFGGTGVDFYICDEIDLGTDARAEQYYAAILTVHNKIGFTADEYPQPGLTLVQVKEIMCNNTEEEAKMFLEDDAWGTGRLYYYYLVATYHRWLHPEDAHFKVQEIIDDPEIIKTVQLDEEAYELATVAYFHSRDIVNAYLLGEGTLPTEELDKVKELLQK